MTWGQAKLAGFIGGGLVVFLFLAALASSWHSRGQEIARLNDWQGQVVMAVTDATVQPDAKGVRKSLKPEAVVAAINGLKRSYDSAHGALDQMTKDTEAAQARAASADKALANATVVFEQRYGSAEKRIAALDSRKPAADPAQQCANMQADSKAAWEGWK